MRINVLVSLPHISHRKWIAASAPRLPPGAGWVWVVDYYHRSLDPDLFEHTLGWVLYSLPRSNPPSCLELVWLTRQGDVLHSPLPFLVCYLKKHIKPRTCSSFQDMFYLFPLYYFCAFLFLLSRSITCKKFPNIHVLHCR